MHETKYENGFVMLYEKSIHNTDVATIIVCCKVGSINESDGIRGICHFVEHMCFKGCGKYGTSYKISKIMDSMGAYFNAYTEKDYTAYVVKVENQYAGKCLAILGELLLDTRMDKKEYEKERRVVYEENLINEDDYSNMLYEEMDKVMFNGSVYQYPIDTMSYHDRVKISQYSYEDSVNFYQTYYVPSNMVLSICTSLTENEVARYLNVTRFTRMKHVERVPDQVMTIHYRTPKRYINIIKPNISISYLMISFPICGLDNPDIYVLEIIDALMSKYKASFMFNILREDNGLTYKANSFITAYKPLGCFSFYAETDENKLETNGSKKGVYPLILDMIERLREEGIGQEEFKLVHKYLRTSEKVDLQTDYPLAIDNAESYLNGLERIPSHKYYDTVYKNITRRQINKVCKQYFRADRMHVGLISSRKHQLLDEA
jgi:predicted Zn-dependent peptidase